MPTPTQYDQSSLFVNELYLELEREMLTKIGRLIATNKVITPDNVINWQVERLQLLGRLNDEQIRLIAKTSRKTPEAVKQWLSEVGMMAADEIEPGMREALPNLVVPPIGDSNRILETILLFESNARDTLNLVNSTMLATSTQAARDIVAKVTAEVLTGTRTHDQALRTAARQLASQGVTALVDKAGKRWSVEGYMPMMTRAISAQTAAKAQEARMDDYDIDLVEISSHAGSRPTHIKYQGKIYSRSGNSRRYPSLSETSYGSITGIVTGINCRHVMYPYVQGKSIKRYEPYDKRESEELYKLTQRQRAIEREIRAAKKELRMMEQLKDGQGIAEAKKLVRDRQAKIRAFIDEHELTRRRNREQIV